MFANRCARRLLGLVVLVIVMAGCQGWQVSDMAPWPPPVGSMWGDFCVVEPGLIGEAVRQARVVHTSEQLSFFGGPFAPPVVDVAVTHGIPARIVRVNLETGAVGAELGRARSVDDVVGTAGLWAAWVQRDQDRGVWDGYLVGDAVLSDRVDSLGVVGTGASHDGIFFDVRGLSWVESLPGGSAKVHVYSPPGFDPKGSFRREVEVPRPDAVMHFGRESLLLRYGSGAGARIMRVGLGDLSLSEGPAEMSASGVSAWWLVTRAVAWTDGSGRQLSVMSYPPNEPVRRMPVPSGWRGAAYGLFPSILVVTGPEGVMVANLDSAAGTFLPDVQVNAATFDQLIINRGPIAFSVLDASGWAAQLSCPSTAAGTGKDS